MLFNSFPFLFLFLPIVLFIALRLKGIRLLQWVTVCSFVFYSFAGHIWFLVPMAFTTLLDFYLGQEIAACTKKSARTALLCLSLAGNLGLLFYFKYAGLILHSGVFFYNLLGNHSVSPALLKIFDVVLPAGISFYTFQTVSYIIDVYRGECPAEVSIWKFAGFVSFFPHLVAGPLTRHNQLIPSLERISENGINPRWTDGLLLFSIGLCKKVLVADRIANLIDPMIADPAAGGMLTAWLTMLGYACQIYFDFSGYSDMAIGLGRLFGVELPQNFNSPYIASNPSDFWRRWHMTLSAWLRDYLYISLGGNRCSKGRQKFNLVATMVLGGLWHGANWTFATWGLYHGILLVLYHRFKSSWDNWSVIYQRAVTFILVCFGWVAFRAQDFKHMGRWFAALFGRWGLGLSNFQTEQAWLVLLLIVSLGIVNFFKNASSLPRLDTLDRLKVAGLGFLTAVGVLLMSHSSKFLYFQF